mmetsp:Transcript_2098/g.3086  ORF Transcript_2098/g.3086 Transcript_2098/m.3086 type:complete len:441 (+) Transcript_2098:80-1402(+)
MEENHRAASSPRRDYVLIITYVNIILYALCYQLQRPVEPFLVQLLTESHNDPAQVSLRYGQLQSFFSALQTVGSPLVGILLDRVGVRKASALVFLSSAFSYAILSSATTMTFLFLSKVPTILQHAFLVAQAAAAISTGDKIEDRAQALGRMTTAYTIGGTLGPALGGFLVDRMGDMYLGAKLAVFGSLASVILSLLFLPDKNGTTPVGISNENAKTASSISHNTKKRSLVEELQYSFALAMRSNLWPLLLVKVIGGFAASMYSTALPLVLTQKLNFDPSQLGLNMSSAMFAVAVFGAFGMAPLARTLGPIGMGHIGLLARAGCASVFAIVVTTAFPNQNSLVERVVIVSVFHALASHMLATGITTQTTGAVTSTEQGTLLGLEHGLFSMARIGAPTFGTWLLTTSGGFWSIAIICGTIDCALVGLLILKSTRVQSKVCLQ